MEFFKSNQEKKEDIIDNKKKEEIILNKIPKLIHTSFFMINCRGYWNELVSKFNKLADMEIEYLREKAKDLNGTIPLELNKLIKLPMLIRYMKSWMNSILK